MNNLASVFETLGTRTVKFGEKPNEQTFTLYPISALRWSKIEASIPAPQPPRQRFVEDTGPVYVFNPHDPEYKRKVAERNEMITALIVAEMLRIDVSPIPEDMPGGQAASKWAKDRATPILDSMPWQMLNQLAELAKEVNSRPLVLEALGKCSETPSSGLTPSNH